MTLTRIAIVFGLLIVAQGGVFVWRFSDLIYLQRPVEEIATDARTFRAHAAEAFDRERLTRQHLETLAQAASRLGEAEILVEALERRVRLDPGDAHVKLRLAEAHRQAGRLDRAEALYTEILADPTGVSR